MEMNNKMFLVFVYRRSYLHRWLAPPLLAILHRTPVRQTFQRTYSLHRTGRRPSHLNHPWRASSKHISLINRKQRWGFTVFNTIHGNVYTVKLGHGPVETPTHSGEVGCPCMTNFTELKIKSQLLLQVQVRPDKPDITLREALSKAMKLRELIPENCVVYTVNQRWVCLCFGVNCRF